MKEESLMKELSKVYPNCKEGFLEEVLKCVEIHSRKNHDYNGSSELYLVTGIKGRIADVWRKMIRIMTLGWFAQDSEVKTESLEETSRDLTVYSILLTIELHKKQQDL